MLRTMNRRQFLSTVPLCGMGLKANLLNGRIMNPDTVTYLNNPALQTVREGYRGAPFRNGRFLNENRAYADKSFRDVLKWMLSPNPQKQEKVDDTFALQSRFIGNVERLPQNSLVWLGHASFLMRIGDRVIVTDPCLTHPPMSHRLVDLPIHPTECSKIDYVLISHGHFDHLDEPSLGLFQSPTTRALIPLKMSSLIRSMNKRIDTQEASWYQEYSIGESFRVTFLPAQHWHLRVPWDRNKVLWGGFIIQAAGSTIYFAGDTGYAGHFKDMFELFGPIDYCLLPIGAYRPDYIMKENHMNPEEAVRAFHDLHGRVLIPMHYGTFDLADEPLGEPVRWLREIQKENGIQGTLIIPDVGEVVRIDVATVPKKEILEQGGEGR